MKKRAQITMESLLLYGAAILVVLLAIAALTYFGVLDMGRWLPQKCNMGSSGIFACEAYAINGDTLQIELKNTESRSVQILGGEFLATDSGLADGCDSVSFTGDGTLTPGEKETITIDCSGGINAGSGSRLQGQVVLTHNYVDSTLEMTTKGDISINVP